MDKITELRELGRKIEERRVELNLSKNALCQNFGQLGSTKTYGRILNEADDLAQLDLAAQLENYRAAWELVQAFNEDPEEMKIYADFGFIGDVEDAVAEALKQTDNTRFVLITADSGGGKSTSLDHLAESESTKKIFYKIEASEAWRMREGSLLGSLLMEMGRFDGSDAPRHQRKANYSMLPVGSNARLEKAIEIIDGRRVIIGIDEFHHIGPAGINVVKTLINRTRAVIVGAAMPELMARISKTSHAETKQLFHNRLSAHVRIPAPSAPEVMKYLARRGVKFAGPKEASEISKKLSDDAAHFGLWKFVKRCAKKARERTDKPLGNGDFAAIIGKVKASTNVSMG